ncbi:MAG: oligosaccharide flippase family protein [Candidatus Woesearchaeota archaeon]
MEDKHKFLINNIFVFSNRIFSKVITLIILLVIARTYSVSQFGELVLIVTATTIFSFVLDFGSNTLAVREIAINNEKRFFLVKSILVTKVFFFLIVSVLFSGFIYKFLPHIKLQIIFLFALGVFFESSLLTLVKQFEGLEKMNISSSLIILERIILGISLIIINSPNLFLRYSLSYLISNGLTTLIALWLSRFNKDVILKKMNFEDIKYVVNHSFIFFLFGLLSIIYNRADTFLLQILSGSEQLGLYRANFQIIEAIYFIPMSLGVSILPMFSRFYSSSNEKFLKFFNLLFEAILIFGLIITLFIYSNSYEIIRILFGEKFTRGSNILKLLSLTIPIFFLNSFIGNTLISLKREKIQLISMFSGTFFKLIMLYFLTMNFGVNGTCIAVIVGETVNLIFQFVGVLDVELKLRDKFFREILLVIGLIAFHLIYPLQFIFSIILCFTVALIFLSKLIKDYKKLS